jgi:hypothetical protein
MYVDCGVDVHKQAQTKKTQCTEKTEKAPKLFEPVSKPVLEFVRLPESPEFSRIPLLQFQFETGSFLLSPFSPVPSNSIEGFVPQFL